MCDHGRYARKGGIKWHPNPPSGRCPGRPSRRSISSPRRSDSAILTGALPPGQQFSIRELARQLGVSHIPIRESLRRLEGQGLIILKQAQSATVASLTTEDMESIYNLRLAIERSSAARSVPKYRAAGLEQLAEWLELSRDPDPEIAWKGHHDFHAGLVAPAASAWDLRILDLLWTAAERYTHLVFDPTRSMKKSGCVAIACTHSS